MSKYAEADLYRVVYSSGGAFYTSARTATEFVLDPVFFQFMVLSIFLFSSLMLALEVPFLAQIILLGAGIVSTFFWLTIAISIYIGILTVFGSRTIFTPLLLLPMQVLNTFVMDYMLRLFETSFSGGFNGLWEISLRTLIIIVCLDIFHGRFVAPQHRLYAGNNKGGLDKPSTSSVALHPNPISAAATDAKPVFDTKDDIGPVNATEAHEAEEVVSQEAPSNTESSVLEIGSAVFDLSEVRYIKSEDHYLFIQQQGQGKMVRGKLRDVAAKIDVSWGLQINRSVWVSFSAIEAVQETPNGRLEVHLSDENVFRVAEARRVFFLHNANLQGLSVQTG